MIATETQCVIFTNDLENLMKLDEINSLVSTFNIALNFISQFILDKKLP